MRAKRLAVFFLVLIFISFFPEEAEAQRRVRPRRYHLRGFIELGYRDYSSIAYYNGSRTKNETTLFEQRYSFGIQSYILHPKIAVFSTDVTFRHGRERNIIERSSRDIGYGLSLTLLPQRPSSLDLYASRNIWEAETYEAIRNSYGMVLRLSLQDLLSATKHRGGRNNRRRQDRNRNNNMALLKGLPSLTVSYDHQDYSSERGPGKTERDSLRVDIYGLLNPIRTSYRLGYEFSDYSSSNRSHIIQHIRGNTDTAIKSGHTLRTTFQYSDVEFSKLMLFIATLQGNPTRRLDHDYHYSYYSSEIGDSRSDSHDIRGRLNYRFTERLFVSAYLSYTLSRRDGVSEDSYTYSINPVLNYSYGRPIKGLDFSSGYSLSCGIGEKGVQSISYSLGLGLATRSLRWGRIYTEYVFTHNIGISNQEDVIQHSLRAGVDGRGPWRAYWRAGWEYSGRGDEGRIIPTYYILRGEGGYPVGRRGLLTLKGEYNFREIDHQDTKRFYYEARFNYLIRRNLSLIAWLGEGSEEIEGRGFKGKTRNYELRLHYKLRKTSLSLEYRNERRKEPSTLENRIIYLRATRSIW